MKKDTVLWVLIAVLFMGQAILFTMNCTKSRYNSCAKYSKHCFMAKKFQADKDCSSKKSCSTKSECATKPQK